MPEIKVNRPDIQEFSRVYRGSIALKTISGTVALLVIFAICTGLIGYNRFTSSLVEQYATDAGRTAYTAMDIVSGDDVEWLSESGGEGEEYNRMVDSIERLTNSSGSTFIYVIVPDLTDYAHITFLISTINKDSEFTRYDYGYYRETTNDEYREKYKRMWDGESDFEMVVRDRGYIETDKHITAMRPLRDSSGKTTAILCVQRQLDALEGSRSDYVNKVFLLTVVLSLISIIIMSLYLHGRLIDPLTVISAEARRFAEEGKKSEGKLTDSINNKDEIGLLAYSIDSMEEQIIDHVSRLTTITAERERINTELSLAKRIQADMLPNTFPALPEYTEFEIFASMDPAKEVGGDFYDFFMLDDDHLCVVMADVSGKGVPAALFMMASRSILANNAMTGKTPAQILTDTNKAICANNREEMFVTVWLGILELSTGRLTAANAGHEYPVIKPPGLGFELFRDKHGFVIGGMDGAAYSEYELQLKPGSKIFVYTDGVPEATDENKELFGNKRMLTALNENADADPEVILGTVRRHVDEFVGDAEQFDDITMLCMEYKGKA